MRYLQHRLLSMNCTRKLVYQHKLNCPKSLSTSFRTLQTITQEETVAHCLLFILQSLYLHNLSLHTSSQPITSRVYQRLLYLLTNEIAHQDFWLFKWRLWRWLPHSLSKRRSPTTVYGLPRVLNFIRPISLQAKHYAFYGEHIFRFKQQSHTGEVITLFIDYMA